MNIFEKIHFVLVRLPSYIRKTGGVLPFTRKSLIVLFYEGINGVKERVLRCEEQTLPPPAKSNQISSSSPNDLEVSYLSYKEKLDFHRSRLNDLKLLIDDKNIKVISFDIFDTLLVRPSLLPTDIFYLVAERVNKKFDIDFIELRLNAESKIGNENLNIYDIYKWIGSTYEIEPQVCNQLMEEEINAEKYLLEPRKELMDLYQYAVNSGKRVIAISDMYLTEGILSDILVSKGFDKLSKIYVSNQYGKRKSRGDLFDAVLNLEHCRADEILHIGDNVESDFRIPLKKGIVAFHYPNLLDIILAENSLWSKAYHNFKAADPFCRIILGFIFHRFMSSTKCCNSSAMFPNCYHLGVVGLGSVTLGIVLSILNVIEKEGYKKVFFASRDGYIPHKIYNKLKGHVSEALGGEYFQAGRVLYYSALHRDFDSFISPNTYGNKLTIGDFIIQYLHDYDLKNDILKSLSDSDKKISIDDAICWKRVLVNYKEKIENYIQKDNLLLKKYYAKVFKESSHHIIFDCGYSGSISRSLSKVMPDHIFDKLYLWQSNENKEWDQKVGTRTFSLFGDMNTNRYGALHLLFEEIFSPVDSRAVSINESGEPQFIKEPHSEKMLKDLEQSQQGIEDCCTAFIDKFGSYIENFKPQDLSFLLNGINEAFNHSPYCECEILRNIVFADAFTTHDKSLAQKIEEGRNYEYPLIGTGFLNPDNYLKNDDVYPLLDNPIKDQRIGVHFHLYDPSLVDEVLFYLKKLPQQTDVFITTPKNTSIPIFKEFFTMANNLDNPPKIIFTPNKGRDVAPWSVGLNDIQNHYDLFGHFHGKRSPQNGINGEIWRKYLLSNLLSEQALNEIFSIFGKYPKIGCIFPGPYNYIIDIYRKSNIEVISENQEIFENLVTQMTKSPYHFMKSDMFYSVGTMFWYRPLALRSLFNLKLSSDDFPDEPLGFDGTVPHAIERILKVACEVDGYYAKAWTSTQRDLTLSYMHN